MKLDDIGFYTLSDDRAAFAYEGSPLWRCELLITDQCNFRCPYCRGTSSEARISQGEAYKVLDYWLSERLKNVRFSGGEPTLVPWLLELCQRAATGGARVAISTNGSADEIVYDRLLRAGVTDFSVSLDACCAETADKMAGRDGVLDRVQESIRYLAARTYVSVGVVFAEANMEDATRIVEFAHGLGVADIRVIPAAQYGPSTGDFDVSDDIVNAHPILAYRVNRIRKGLPARGITQEDSHRCYLGLDDMAVCGDNHYPCIIALREGAAPVGDLSGRVRQDRADWVERTDTYDNRICRENCLDVCVAYNNRARELRG